MLAAAYAVAVLLMLSSLLDLGARLWPLQLGNEEWRFGALGILFNSLVTPVLGLALAMGAAYIGRHRRTLALFSGIALLVAAITTLAFIAFVFASIAVSGRAEAAVKPAFEVAIWKTVVLALAVLPATALLGLGGMRSLRGGNGGVLERGRLVVGQPS